MKRYRLTPEAENDLDEITDFLAADHPTAAARLIDGIQERCRALAEMPGSGRSREELAPNLRSSVVGKYVIFYRPDAEGVEIIRVIHGHRDIPRLFSAPRDSRSGPRLRVAHLGWSPPSRLDPPPGVPAGSAVRFRLRERSAKDASRAPQGHSAVRSLPVSGASGNGRPAASVFDGAMSCCC
jgi:toxin ParE1/3/4